VEVGNVATSIVADDDKLGNKAVLIFEKLIVIIPLISDVTGLFINTNPSILPLYCFPDGKNVLKAPFSITDVSIKSVEMSKLTDLAHANGT
jgi:hypothetical protein